MRVGFIGASICVSIQASSSVQDLSYIINDTFLRGWKITSSPSLTKWSHLVASSYFLTSVAPKLRVGWPNHGQLLAYILQRGVLSKHLRIFQTMILAKQYCHERVKQQCLSLISDLSLSQISSTSFTAAPIFKFQTYPISTYTTMPWRASNMTPCHPISPFQPSLGPQTAGFGSSLDQSKWGPLLPQHRGLNIGESQLSLGNFPHFELQTSWRFASNRWLFHVQVGVIFRFPMVNFQGCKSHVLCIWANLIRHH